MQANAFADFSPVLQAGGVDVLFCGAIRGSPRRHLARCTTLDVRSLALRPCRAP